MQQNEFPDARDYLIRINNSVENSIRNVDTLCSKARFRPLVDVKDGLVRLETDEVYPIITLYNRLSQGKSLMDLSELACDPNLLLILKERITHFKSEVQYNTFRSIVTKQISRILELQNIIEKWVYYTQDVSSSYTGKDWEIFDIIDRIILARLHAHIIYNILSSLFSNNSISQHIEGELTINRENNTFNRMHLSDVRKWFIQLAENNSRNGKPFLTTEQVEQLIERAFIGNNKIPAPALNAEDREKGKVVGLFHLFYHHCNSHRPKMGKIDPSATHEKYIRLFADNLDRWTFDQVKNNFRRAGNWKIPA